jgi:hypothetical protein
MIILTIIRVVVSVCAVGAFIYGVRVAVIEMRDRK